MEQAFEVNSGASTDEEKIAELTAIIQAVSARARARYPEGQTEGPGIRIPLADLLPVVHARDAAQAKVAAIGAVNPRAGGVLNALIQKFKKLVARSLQWFVRDQIVFNREAVAAVEAVLEALNEHNRVLVSLASQTNEQIGYVREELAARVRELSAQIDARAAELQVQMGEAQAYMVEVREQLARDLEPVHSVIQQVDLLKAEARELKDIRMHWVEWRAAWEQKLGTNEIQFLRSVADLQGAFQHRVTQMESNFRDMVKGQHADYLGALDRTTIGIHKQLAADFQRVRTDYDRMIHTELRLLRQRGGLPGTGAAVQANAGIAAAPAPASAFDYARFAERFRGPEEYVRRSQEFYKPVFAGCERVLDIGCGRGEFLETMGEAGIAARGIELSAESVAQCVEKGLMAEQADLFTYLAAQPDEEFDGIMCSQVVEHLPPERLAEMVNLCAAKLARGGVMAVETPNPECLAIFATHFYLDPTHSRPVPSPLMAFYMEEAGIGGVEVHPLSPAVESFPEIAELPAEFREKFFGGLDYAIVGRKL